MKPVARAPRVRPVDRSIAVPIPLSERGAAAAIVLLLVLTPLIVVPDAKDAFRLVKMLTAGWFGLLSLTMLTWSLRKVGVVSAPALWRRHVVRALVPLTLVVSAGMFFTTHPIYFREAFADFAIAVACLVGWTLAFDVFTLWRLLAWTIPIATLVAALGIDQFSGALGALDWMRVQEGLERLRITSTLGGPGDLGCLLVLPTLVAVARLPAASRFERRALSAALLVMMAAMLITATLAALAATAIGGAVLWSMRRETRLSARPATALRAILVAGLIATTSIAVPMVRTRMFEKAAELARGDINAVLTGRLDGWRAAAWMLRRSPVTGVGQGAYRTEYAEARLALIAQGTAFFKGQHQVMFATPHNEILSVAAEQGLPGLAALAWAIWALVAAIHRVQNAERRAFAVAGAAALTVLCVLWFPLHMAAVAWPWLLFLAWVFRESEAPA